MASAAPRRLLLAVLPLLAGCAMVGAFDARTLESVRSGEKAFVMLRFVFIDQDGRSIPPFGTHMIDDSLGLAVGDFDTGGLASRPVLVARFPTEEARQEGIAYITLEPGYHYLAIQGARRTAAISYAGAFPSLPRWRIEVPPGLPLIYAGSIQMRGISERMMFGETLITRVDQEATVVRDETPWAREAAARDMPDLGAPVTRLAVLHAGPILLGTPRR